MFPLWPIAFSFWPRAKLPWQVELYGRKREDIIWRGLREARHSGVSKQKDAHGRTNVASKSWSWGDSHRVGNRDNGLRENCVYGLCSSTPHTIQSLRLSTWVTFQEISTDVGLRPQLSRRSSWGGGGQKGVGCCLSGSARSLGFMAHGREYWYVFSLPFFLCLCALLLSVIERMIASLWCWQTSKAYLAEWHWFCFLSYS